MKKYSIAFAVCYFIASAGMAFLGYGLKTTAANGVYAEVAQTLAAAAVAAWWFINDVNRLPAPDEASSFALRSVVYFVVIDIVVMAGSFVIFLPQEMQEALALYLQSSNWSFGMACVVALSMICGPVVAYFGIRLSFLWITEALYKRRNPVNYSRMKARERVAALQK